MLEIENISVAFEDVMALDDVSLELEPGSVTAVLGPSGSGKSTLLRVVAGLQRPDSGRILWQGQDITNQPSHLRGFGLMFQDYALFPHRSVARNVGFGLKVRGDAPAEVTARVDEVLGWVGLAGFGDRAIVTLSGGEQQRVALARAAAPRPKILLADEPTGNLDAANGAAIIDLLFDLRDKHGATLIMVTHAPELAARCDRVVNISDGRIA